jgi:hypothetical protein
MTPLVHWVNKERMSYACCHFLNTMFDLYDCEHQCSLDGWPKVGCIMVLHGGNETRWAGRGETIAQKINEVTANLPWMIFVSIGDESSEFPLHLFNHPNKKIWCQTPLPSTQADRYLIEGYPAGTKRHPRNGNFKPADFSFWGQVTHERRRQAVKAMKSLQLDYSLIETDGFGKGLPQENYLYCLSDSLVVPCPSGPASPDTFRIWEALECGAVPIVDSRSLRDETVGFWPVVLGDHPLPMIDDWAMLPEVMDAVLADYDRIQHFCQYWWKSYRLSFKDWLAKDLVSLGAK